MWFIIKKEISWYLKNPVYYIGALLVFLFVFGQCKSALNISFFEENAEIKTFPIEKQEDADIYDGYLPANEEEIFHEGLQNVKNDLVNEVGLSENEATSIISKIEEQNMNRKQAISYIKKKCPYIKNVNSYFFVKERMKKGTVKELNNYISKSLEKETYSSYFGRRYSDYLSVAIFFYALVLLAFLAVYDYKKDMYELLHTKPVKSWKYILGKVMGGSLAICFVVAIITIIFDLLMIMKSNNALFPINVLDIWYYVVICNLSIVFYMSCMYFFIASLFKTSLPAIPVLLLQGIYSNLGKTGENGIYEYINRPFSVMIRFPGAFFETSFKNMQYINQAILIICGCAFVLFSMYRWSRRRLY